MTEAMTAVADSLMIPYAKDALDLVLHVSIWPLLAGFVVGALFSFIGSLFQIQDSSFSYVPKLAAVLAVIGFTIGPGMRTVVGFAAKCFGNYLTNPHKFFP